MDRREPFRSSPRVRDRLIERGLVFIGTALFPRLAHRLRWPTRLGPRGLVAYIAFNTVVVFSVRSWLIPYLKRMSEEHERAKEELRRELGREPTDDEMFAHLALTQDS